MAEATDLNAFTVARLRRLTGIGRT